MKLFYLYSRLALLILGIFAGGVAVIHAQPYNNHALHDFLTPPGSCTMPCFMGIQPGVTHGDEAVALLRADAWVGSVEVHTLMPDDSFESSPVGVVQWTWSGRQPEWIDAAQEGSLALESNIVSNIRVQATVPLGDVRLTLGAPGSQRVANAESPAGARYMSYAAIYPDQRLWISIGVLCPVRQTFNAYQQPVFLEWFNSPRVSFNPSSAWSEIYQTC